MTWGPGRWETAGDVMGNGTGKPQVGRFWHVFWSGMGWRVLKCHFSLGGIRWIGWMGWTGWMVEGLKLFLGSIIDICPERICFCLVSPHVPGFSPFVLESWLSLSPPAPLVASLEPLRRRRSALRHERRNGSRGLSSFAGLPSVC